MELHEQIAVRNARLEREAHGVMVRDMVKTALLCVFWCALGLYCLAWAFHTTSKTYGRIFFWAGIGIGNGGMMYTLASAYIRGEKRGDW